MALPWMGGPYKLCLYARFFFILIEQRVRAISKITLGEK